MPRTAKQNQAIRDKRKSKITLEGIRLISLYGLENVVIDDIAKEVGCSHGLFYHYFKKTEDLYAEIPQFILESKKFAPYVAKYLPMKDMNPRDAINLMSKNLEDLPNYPKIVLHAADIIFTSTLSLKDFGYYDFFIKLIEDGQKEGYIREGDPEILLMLCVDVIDGYVTRAIKRGSEAKPIPAELLSGLLIVD